MQPENFYNYIIFHDFSKMKKNVYTRLASTGNA